MKNLIKLSILSIVVLALSSCCSMKKQCSYEPDYAPGPPTIIYKTTADYSQNVPVILNDEKTKIVGYFGAKDLTYKGELAYPTVLEEGYLLDNIGLRKNVAYTSLKIETYTKSAKAYTTDELFSLIIDDDPIKEMYNCGNRSKLTDEVAELNEVIKNKGLKKCKKLK